MMYTYIYINMNISLGIALFEFLLLSLCYAEEIISIYSHFPNYLLGFRGTAVNLHDILNGRERAKDKGCNAAQHDDDVLPQYPIAWTKTGIPVHDKLNDNLS